MLFFQIIVQDVIWNQNIKLDRMFMFALSQDIAKVMIKYTSQMNTKHVNFNINTIIMCVQDLSKIVIIGIRLCP